LHAVEDTGGGDGPGADKRADAETECQRRNGQPAEHVDYIEAMTGEISEMDILYIL
jgi:hypothetical protein